MPSADARQSRRAPFRPLWESLDGIGTLNCPKTGQRPAGNHCGKRMMEARLPIGMTADGRRPKPGAK